MKIQHKFFTKFYLEHQKEVGAELKVKSIKMMEGLYAVATEVCNDLYNKQEQNIISE